MSKGGGKPYAVSNTAVEADEAVRCYTLRLKGASLRDIATYEGVSRTTVQRRLDAYIANLIRPQAEQYRQIETDRLDVLSRRVWDVLDAHAGDETGAPMVILAAADRLIRIADRRARLLGLDMPAKLEVQAPPDPAEIELGQMIREAKAKLAVEEAAIRRGEQR